MATATSRSSTAWGRRRRPARHRAGHRRRARHAGRQRRIPATSACRPAPLVVLMDTGAAAADRLTRRMPAACRSSSRSTHRIVVNCGLPATSRETWRQVARATAAHSTVTFNDTSSCRFLAVGSLQRLRRRADRGGPQARPRGEERGDGGSCCGLADGYAAASGSCISVPSGSRPTAADSTARTCSCAGGESPAGSKRRIRGPLPPPSAVRQMARTGHGVMLVLPNADVDVRRLRATGWSSRRASISPAATGRAAPCRSCSTAVPARPRGVRGTFVRPRERTETDSRSRRRCRDRIPEVAA